MQLDQFLKAIEMEDSLPVLFVGPFSMLVGGLSPPARGETIELAIYYYCCCC
jgi:hypothetical protein